ncbi:MAG: hypothetical protein ABIG32_03340 [Candidatus Uhrbacteria bacterium]|nr:hypothetical protein [Patescibacteria group bacterium]MBU1906601.1 hypothetical protein [Patescibacteria group bacterium]
MVRISYSFTHVPSPEITFTGAATQMLGLLTKGLTGRMSTAYAEFIDDDTSLDVIMCLEMPNSLPEPGGLIKIGVEDAVGLLRRAEQIFRFSYDEIGASLELKHLDDNILGMTEETVRDSKVGQ